MLATLGADVPGRLHLEALPCVRDSARSESPPAPPRTRPGPARHVDTGIGLFEEAVAGADLVCCCTDARQPVIRAAWLVLGTHVSSGSFGPELDAETARAGRSSSSGAARS